MSWNNQEGSAGNYFNFFDSNSLHNPRIRDDSMSSYRLFEEDAPVQENTLGFGDLPIFRREKMDESGEDSQEWAE